MDGLGYPSGLAGERIPRFARIIAVADAFDSMTSTRAYRSARPVEEALAELRLCAGTQFDPAIVDALEEALRQAAARGEPWMGDGTVPGSPREAADFAQDDLARDGFPGDGFHGDGFPSDGRDRDDYERDDYDHDDPAFTVPPRAVVGLPADRRATG
jgi:hypothetical protein